MRFLNLLLLFFVLVSLASCHAAQPTVDVSLVETAVASTKTALPQTPSKTLSQPNNLTETESTILGKPSLTPTLSPTLNATPSETPKPEIVKTQKNCSDKIKFVSENVQDGSVFSPGEKFEKKWVLRNIGTCTWNNQYKLVFVDGDTLGEEVEIPLSAEVAPENSYEFSIIFTSPAQVGKFRGNWKIKNDQGVSFGLGSEGDKPFWVEIEVAQSSNIVDLGTPTWSDNFDKEKDLVYLGSDVNSSYTIKNGYLNIKIKEPIGDLWRMMSRPPIEDFYIEVVYKTGDNCSGKDSYGMITHSPDTEDDVDTGYIFVFSCDANYRFYRMDQGSFVGIQNWTRSVNLNGGPNQNNTIGVLSRDSLFTIYINGVKVADFTDSTYQLGIFGFVARAEDEMDFEVNIDRVSTWDGK